MIKIENINDKIYRSHTIEIKPNSQMKKYLEGCFGFNRYIYNLCIKIFKEYKKQNNEYITRQKLQQMITFIKQSKDKEWMYKYSNSIQNKAKDRFWEAKEKWSFYKICKFPKFKSKREHFQSFTYDPTKGGKSILFDKTGKKFKFDHGYTSPVDKQYRWIKMTEKLRFKGKVKIIHIFRKYDKYYANFVVKLDNPIIKTLKHNNNVIGLDIGIKTLVHDSNNKIIKGTRYLDRMNKLIKRERYYQSQMDKRYKKNKKLKDQSKKYHKMRTKYYVTLRKKSNLKLNFYHQFTTIYSNENDNVSMENLDNKGMRSKKNKYKNNRKLLAQIPFYLIKKLLKYKAYNLIEIDRYFPSTQICSNCGNRKIKHEKLKLSDRIYKCNKCGFEIDRDYNAAINIKNEGIRLLG